MKQMRSITNAAQRGWYCFAMYSGLRALRNRVGSLSCRSNSEIGGLRDVILLSEDLGPLILNVHLRPRPSAATLDGNYGICSLRQPNPRVSRWIYQFFCATSHFGCGHFEIAFFERSGEVTFYGIRNMASANARRLGLHGLAARLRLSKSGEDVQVLSVVSKWLAGNGYVARHAKPSDCIELAVNNRLLPPSAHGKAKAILYRKYNRLHALFDHDLA
ncbi:MAG: hypothetical protein ACI8QS_003107 [Planctomycetota bacterium]|jgi:hypothetical protein